MCCLQHKNSATSELGHVREYGAYRRSNGQREKHIEYMMMCSDI